MEPLVLAGAVGGGVALAVAHRLLRSHASSARSVGAGGVLAARNFFVDLYAARAGSGVILFDTGLDPKGRAVDVLLRALKATRADVTDVFLTHGHPDHTAAAPLFPHARIHGGHGDLDRFALRFRGRKPAERAFRRLFPSRPVAITDPLLGRTEIPVGDAGDRVLAIPLPGDTPGAFAWLFRGVLIAGDGLELRAGRLHFARRYATDDPEENRRSIAALPSVLANEKLEVLCTAHGGWTARGWARPMLAEIANEARAIEGEPMRWIAGPA